MSRVTISQDIVQAVRQLLDEPVEYAGVIHIPRDCARACTATRHRVKRGQAGAVITPYSLASYHTHPRSRYVANSVVWGWPSGDDLRESVKFALNNVRNVHFVFTVEGVYVLKARPTLTAALRRLPSDELRGVAIAVMESFFGTKHGDRRASFGAKPSDFCKVANAFKLEYLVNARDAGACGKLTCAVPLRAIQQAAAYAVTRSGRDTVRISVTPDAVQAVLANGAARLGKLRWFSASFVRYGRPLVVTFVPNGREAATI